MRPLWAKGTEVQVPLLVAGNSRGRRDVLGRRSYTNTEAMIDAALAGASDTTATLAHALLPIVTAGFAEPNPACWKAVLHALGEIATPTLRRPMCEASDAATRRLLDAMSEVRNQTSVTTP